MAIDKWEEPQRPDYAKVLREREEALERGRLRRQQEQEALEWRRKTKAEQERAELWCWFESQGGADALVADAQEAAERAEQRRRTEQVQSEIYATNLLLMVEKAVHDSDYPTP